MKFFCALALLGIFAANIEAKEVVCYIPTWGDDITPKVNTSLCTMFMLDFGTLDASGTVTLPDNFANFKKLRTPTSKLLLAIGGATSGTAAFSQVASTSATRDNFAQNCLNLVQSNGLDGIDNDWEFPDSSERANFVALHQDLKNKLGPSNLVTTAVSDGQRQWWTNNNNRGTIITNCTTTGLFSYPPDCTQYYHCTQVGRPPLVRPCPPTLFWNQYGYCDWSFKVLSCAPQYPKDSFMKKSSQVY